MKILFFGTPLFAEIVLERLLKSKHKVVGVVARADKPAGRGNKMVSPKIVEIARENAISVFQPEKLKDEIENFKNIDCDIFVTASYGKILPKALLDIRPCINVHPSLLPKYRGATPIQSALLSGDEVTGVSIMKTEVGMDDGDIFAQEKVEILPEDDYVSLLPKLAEVGARLLLETLDEIEAKGFENVKRTKQNHDKATFVKTIQKEDGLLDFSQDSKALENKVRALCDSPVAYFFVGGERIKVFKAHALSDEEIEKFDVSCLKNYENPNHKNLLVENSKTQKNDKKAAKNAVLDENSSKKSQNFGEIICTKKRFLISAKGGILEILRCQAPGGKVLDASAFLNGFHFKSNIVDEVHS